MNEREEGEKLAAAVAEYIFAASEALPIALEALREISGLGDDRYREAVGTAHLALARIKRELKAKRKGT